MQNVRKRGSFIPHQTCCFQKFITTLQRNRFLYVPVVTRVIFQEDWCKLRYFRRIRHNEVVFLHDCFVSVFYSRGRKMRSDFWGKKLISNFYIYGKTRGIVQTGKWIKMFILKNTFLKKKISGKIFIWIGMSISGKAKKRKNSGMMKTSYEFYNWTNHLIYSIYSPELPEHTFPIKETISIKTLCKSAVMQENLSKVIFHPFREIHTRSLLTP